MAKFKCKQSGNFIEFFNEVDIVTTRDNPAYEEVIEVVEQKEEKKVAKKTAVKSEE